MKILARIICCAIVSGLVLLIALALCWPSHPPEVPHHACPEELSRAVLDKVFARVDDSRIEGLDDVIPVQQEILCIRKWATNLSKGCERESYIHWMDFYQRQLDEKKQILMSGRRELNEYEKELAAEQAKLDAYEKAHPVSEPPTCIRLGSVIPGSSSVSPDGSITWRPAHGHKN